MGGHGALRLAEGHPEWGRAVAAFSPAMSSGDPVYDDARALGELPLGIWRGTSDDFYGPVTKFAKALPTPPVIASYSEGGHTLVYWNDHTLDAFAFLSRHVTG